MIFKFLAVDFKNLQQKQQQLDSFILKKLSSGTVKGCHNDNYKFFNEKFLAMFVEIGELANEVRCFKYWSQKHSSKKQVIIEEYADILHFLLSITNHFSYTLSDDVLFSPPHTKMGENDSLKKIITNQIMDFILLSTQFYQHQSQDLMKKIINKFLFIGFTLKFSASEIINAYNSKNQINYRRQETGY